MRKLLITVALAGVMTTASLGLASNPAQAVGCVWVTSAGNVWYLEPGGTISPWDGDTYPELSAAQGAACTTLEAWRSSG